MAAAALRSSSPAVSMPLVAALLSVRLTLRAPLPKRLLAPLSRRLLLALCGSVIGPPPAALNGTLATESKLGVAGSDSAAPSGVDGSSPPKESGGAADGGAPPPLLAMAAAKGT